MRTPVSSPIQPAYSSADHVSLTVVGDGVTLGVETVAFVIELE